MGSESKGTLSVEHDVYVLRLLNPNLHLLQRACETFVAQIGEAAERNTKVVQFEGAIQIVEIGRKETIIQGQTLATKKDRLGYARGHNSVQFMTAWVGAIVLVVLLIATYPWGWRDFNSRPESWFFSVVEKLVGSVAVTSLVAYVHYRSFFASLREHTVRWSIPGGAEKHDIAPRGSTGTA